MYTSYTLKNGATVILVPVEGTRAVTSLVTFPVGSRFEPKNIQGMAHFIEHMMFKGTKKRKNSYLLTREIDRLGAQYNAFTSKEYTGYYIKVDAKYTKTALDILSDMLFESVFDAKELEREKGPIVEELAMYKDNPQMRIGDLFEELMYDGCALGRDIGGTPKHVKNMTKAQMIAFKNKWYSPKNMTIVLAGNITDNAQDLINSYFDRAAAKGPSRPKKTPAVFGSSKKTDRVSIDYRELDQVQLMMGVPGIARTSKDTGTVSVLDSILGDSMSSRLFIKIRERNGLAYSVSSGYRYFTDSGYFYISMGLDPKNVTKAVKMVMSELEKIATKGISKRELEDAKMSVRGGMALSSESSSTRAMWFAKEHMFDSTIETEEMWLKDKLDPTTAKDVQRLAKQLFKKSQMRVAAVGNVQKEDLLPLI
ncbi:MAG: insulinase family protein [Candidatus Magasanikbacteria bacterium]|jgi:predicted Zn-dependent peptidase|nr:insulinase family protein [Candidatus Magasanikbacteria bacterium]